MSQRGPAGSLAVSLTPPAATGDPRQRAGAVVSPSDAPRLVYDGDCAFCLAWVARGRRLLGERVEWTAYQDAAAGRPGVPRDELVRAVHLIEPDGRVTRAAEAVFRALALAPAYGLPLWLYRFLPGFAPVSEACYAWIARRRPCRERVARDPNAARGPTRGR